MGHRRPSTTYYHTKIHKFQERFDAITKNYLRNVHCAVIVYDIMDRNTFDRVAYYVRMFQEEQV